MVMPKTAQTVRTAERHLNERNRVRDERIVEACLQMESEDHAASQRQPIID